MTPKTKRKVNKKAVEFRKFLGITNETWGYALKNQTTQLKTIKKLSKAFELTNQQVINVLEGKQLLNNKRELETAINTLEKHNLWRRDNNTPSIYEMADPKEYGKAIDLVVSEFKRKEK